MVSGLGPVGSNALYLLHFNGSIFAHIHNIVIILTHKDPESKQKWVKNIKGIISRILSPGSNHFHFTDHSHDVEPFSLHELIEFSIFPLKKIIIKEEKKKEYTVCN